MSSLGFKRRQRGARQVGLQRWRYWLVIGGLAVLPALAAVKIASLQVVPGVEQGFEFLQAQGDDRMVREVEIPGYRGVITDRRGEPLAVTTAVLSVTANPQLLDLEGDRLTALAERLGVSEASLAKRIALYRNKQFMYLSRRITPNKAEAVLELDIPGVSKEVEYKRYYPAGEVTAQLLGFTDEHDSGQEGMELAFDGHLAGRPGVKQVLKDKDGRVIKDLRLIRSETPGKTLALSIDLRLQYAAYRELKSAIKHFRAASGSVVILDVQTGEILAMVNQPSFNPNDRRSLKSVATRNRAVIDLIEPGSVMKPLTMVAALESGKFGLHTVIDTSPGSFRVGRKTFFDHGNYGPLNLAGILKKSSQVGTTRIAMELEPDAVRGVFDRVGLGRAPGTGFPGEASGVLPSKARWRPVERATLAFGYGLNVTPLQLAGAYGVLAGDGLKKPLSLLKLSSEASAESAAVERVIDADIAADVRVMMQAVIEPGGTGTRAAVPGYQVAGKTGTSHKTKVGQLGYEDDQYVAVFAGMAPARAPRLVTVVVIDDPRSEAYYGGLVAAPVFSKVTSEALRFLNIPPEPQTQDASPGGVAKKSANRFHATSVSESAPAEAGAT